MFGNDSKIGLSSILLPVNKLILNTNYLKNILTYLLLQYVNNNFTKNIVIYYYN